MDRYVKVDDVIELINTSNRGNCDYFIVDQIEELCVSQKTITEAEIRAKAIEEFAEKMKGLFKHIKVADSVIDMVVKEMKGE